MSKQDRQGARTVADLERKYNYDQRFNEVMGVASDAQDVAKAAMDSASDPAAKLTQEEIFNILTNNGTFQGIYRGEDGKVYINAEVVQVINLIAEKLKSAAGTSVEIEDGEIRLCNNNGKLVGRIMNLLFGMAIIFYDPDTEDIIGGISRGLGGIELTLWDQDEGKNSSHSVQWKTVNGVKTLVAF